ncbi:MAG: hypothetical protein WC045_03650 [Patescibacteria group bacterium]
MLEGWKNKIALYFEEHRFHIGYVLVSLVLITSVSLWIYGEWVVRVQAFEAKIDQKIEQSQEDDVSAISNLGSSEDTEKREIIFDIEGAVRRPGVY